MPVRLRLNIVPLFVALAACEPRRAADFAGVVTGLGRGTNGWTASLEADARDTRHRTGEPMIPTHTPAEVTGHRVCAWFVTEGNHKRRRSD